MKLQNIDIEFLVNLLIYVAFSFYFGLLIILKTFKSLPPNILYHNINSVITLLCDLFLLLLDLQTTRTEFDLPEYSVRRRYQDFDWLRNKLEDSQPTHLIPVGRGRPFTARFS